MIDLLVRYGHFLGIIVLASALVAQHLLYSPSLNLAQFKRLRIIDRIYGAGAAIAFITGMLLWLAFGKPKEFYSEGGLIHLKLTLFVVMAGLSIAPTLFFMRGDKSLSNEDDTITPPKYVIGLIRAELTILILMPLVAVFMASGA